MEYQRLTDLNHVRNVLQKTLDQFGAKLVEPEGLSSDDKRTIRGVIPLGEHLERYASISTEGDTLIEEIEDILTKLRHLATNTPD